MEAVYYDFTLEEEEGIYSYSFSTQMGAFYCVNFSPDGYDAYVGEYPHLLDCGYDLEIFGRTIDSEVSLSFDPKVQPTICRIIADFLKNFGDEIVLLYHCDVSDGKQAIRSRRFRRWFNEHPLKQTLVIEEIAFEVPRNDLFETSDTYYAGFLCRASNPYLEDIKVEFERFRIAPFRK